MSQLYLQQTESDVGWMKRLQDLVSGKFWRGDHNFKYSKKLKGSVAGGVYTILNEWQQVVIQWVTEGKDISELIPLLMELFNRLSDAGAEVGVGTDACSDSTWDGAHVSLACTVYD
jgi:hypothetical protein